jgi:putative Holliday junction resolvase
VEQFVNRWKKEMPDVPVEYVDERFTSVLAHQAMIDGGLRKKARQDKALVDKISATIILEDYLRSRK